MSANGLAACESSLGLDDDAFARLINPLGPFEERPRLAVALSGGPDSLALTLLAGRWARRRGGCVVGVTVDHGLRPASADEALLVGDWLERYGLAHAILRWAGPKPQTGMQAAAREARYRLLGEFCRHHQILHLLLAHHRDDQAETVAMRAERGSGPGGRAGMPAIAEQRGFRILRPLLAVRKTALEATLHTTGQPWLDDPSNRSTAFARGRLRADGLPAAPDLRTLAARRTALDHAVAGWLGRHARIDPLGFIDLDLSALLLAQPDIADAALVRALLAVGGHRYAPGSMAMRRLRQWLAEDRSGTLGGVLVRPERRRLRLIREARAWRGPALPLATPAWLDNRFLVAIRPADPDLMVAVLGERGWRQRRRLDQIRPARGVQQAVGEALPVLLRDGVIVAVPHLGLAAPDAPPMGTVSVRFLPRHALAGAAFGALPANSPRRSNVGDSPIVGRERTLARSRRSP